MASLQLEGFGDDWLVTRQGGEVRLHTFSSPAEVPSLLRRLMALGEFAKPPETKAFSTKSVAVPAATHMTGRWNGNGNGQARAKPAPKPQPVKILPPPVKTSPKPRKLPGASGPVPECKDCGACCFPEDSSARSYVRLAEGDMAQLPKGQRGKWVIPAQEGSFLATKKHASGRRSCVALEGELGGPCSCGVYSDRPLVCRAFERGSEACARARSVALVGTSV